MCSWRRIAPALLLAGLLARSSTGHLLNRVDHVLHMGLRIHKSARMNRHQCMNLCCTTALPKAASCKNLLDKMMGDPCG